MAGLLACRGSGGLGAGWGWGSAGRLGGAPLVSGSLAVAVSPLLSPALLVGLCLGWDLGWLPHWSSLQPIWTFGHKVGTQAASIDCLH